MTKKQAWALRPGALLRWQGETEYDDYLVVDRMKGSKMIEVQRCTHWPWSELHGDWFDAIEDYDLFFKEARRIA